MRVQRIDLENSKPKTLVVEMTIEEAMVVTKWCGGLSPVTSPDYEATDGVYGALVGDVFNRYWEWGIDGAIRGDDE